MPPLFAQNFSSVNQQDSLLIEVGRYNQGVSYDFQIADNKAFVISGNFLKIYDISIPEEIVLISEIEVEGLAHSVSTEGNLVAVGQEDHISIIDISDIANPRLSALQTPGQGVFSVLISDTLLFAGHGGRFVTYSLAISDSIYPLDNLNYVATSFDMIKEDTLVYVAAGRKGLRILSVSDPTDASLLFSSGEIYGVTRGLVKSGNLVFIATEFEGLVTLDVTDPNQVVEVSKLDSLGPSGSVAVNGNIAYVSRFIDNPSITSNPTYVVDISDPAAPMIIGEFASLNEQVWEMEFINNQLTILDEEDGLQIFDASTANSPQLIGDKDSYGWPQDITFENNLMFLANTKDAVQILDVSNIDLIQELATIDSDESWSVAAANDILLVGGKEASDKLKVYDISNPRQPQQIDEFQSGSRVADIVIQNDIAYLANGADGLRIMDISNPAQISELGTLDIFSYAFKIVVEGDLAFIVDLTQDIAIINISNPAQPQLEAFYPISQNRPPSIAVKLPYLFIGGSDAALTIVDVSTPGSPLNVSDIGSSVKSIGIEVQDNFAYVHVRGQQDRLRLYDITNIFQPIQLQAIQLTTNAAQSMSFYDNKVAVGLNDPFIGGTSIYEEVSTIIFYEHPILTGLEGGPNLSTAFKLYQNYPNPFNPSTTIEYDLTTNIEVDITIFDIQGRSVRTLVSQKQSSGSHKITWDGQNGFGESVSSGVYFYRLKIGNKSSTRKMLLIR